MGWTDIATRLNTEDAARGKLSHFTHESVYNRWLRQAPDIHENHFKDDDGFDYKILRYQKKETSSEKGGRKGKPASTGKRAKLEQEDAKEEREDEGDGLQLRHKNDQKFDNPNAEDGASAQSDNARPFPGLTIHTDDLVALHLFQQQARVALRPEVLRLVAESMNERAAGHESEDATEKKRWSAEDCEAAMEAGGKCRVVCR